MTEPKENIILSPDNILEILSEAENNTYWVYKRFGDFKIKYIKDNLMNYGISVIYVGEYRGTNLKDTDLHLLKLINNRMKQQKSLSQELFFDVKNIFV